MQLKAEYSILMDLLFQLIESQSGGNIEPEEAWLNDAQVLSIKLYNHLRSMQRLAEGTSMNGRGTAQAIYIDHASVQVVARAALETYLVFFYIFGTQDQPLSQFRHKTWHLAGLIDRQRYGVRNEEARAKMTQEADVIRQLRAGISQSKHFESSSRLQRRRIMEGFWRVGSSWKELGEKAGFHSKYFSNIYSYFCGYSHSSYASVLQVRDAQSHEDQQILTSMSVGLGLVLMAHFSLAYTCVFPNASTVMSSNPEASRLAETFRFDREDMAKIFGA